MLTRISTGTIVDEEGVEVLEVEGAGCGRVGVLVGMCDRPRIPEVTMKHPNLMLLEARRHDAISVDSVRAKRRKDNPDRLRLPICRASNGRNHRDRLFFIHPTLKPHGRNWATRVRAGRLPPSRRGGVARQVP